MWWWRGWTNGSLLMNWMVVRRWRWGVNWMRFMFWRDGDTIVVNISNKATIAIYCISHGLNTTIGESNLIGSGCKLSISRLFNIVSGSSIFIIHVILEGVGFWCFIVVLIVRSWRSVMWNRCMDRRLVRLWMINRHVIGI
uniref:Uncharacterized protein n=1 Tax=Lepeophtheirus salmonis TaxID=72036 RepID=A0A0K2UE95_LEPSM